MKSSPLLGPFCGSEFLGFSLLKIQLGWVFLFIKRQTIVSSALIHSTLLSSSHSRLAHYFFSYLLTCEVALFANSAIVTIKSDIVTFFHVKSIKVTSVFNLRRKKKSARWPCHAEKSKTNLNTLVSPLWMCSQGSQGCQKMRQDPLNMPHEVWRANIALKLKNI